MGSAFVFSFFFAFLGATGPPPPLFFPRVGRGSLTAALGDPTFVVGFTHFLPVRPLLGIQKEQK